MLMQTPAFALGRGTFEAQAKISARLERIPVTRQVSGRANHRGRDLFRRLTVLAIAYAMPVLVPNGG